MGCVAGSFGWARADSHPTTHHVQQASRRRHSRRTARRAVGSACTSGRRDRLNHPHQPTPNVPAANHHPPRPFYCQPNLSNLLQCNGWRNQPGGWVASSYLCSTSIVANSARLGIRRATSAFPRSRTASCAAKSCRRYRFAPWLWSKFANMSISSASLRAVSSASVRWRGCGTWTMSAS